MEYLKNFLVELNDRFRNNFISSFILSWLVFNWKICILTVWFLTDSNSKIGFNEYTKIIEDLNNNSISIGWPLVFSLLYVTLFQLFRVLLSYLQGLFSKLRSKAEIKGLSGGSISIEKYLKLRENYLEKIDQLETIIQSESEYIDKYDKISSSLNEAKQRENEIRTKHSRLQSSLDPNILNGYWSFQNYSKFDELIFNGKSFKFNFDKLQFNGNEIYFYGSDDSKPKAKGVIILFIDKTIGNNGRVVFTCSMEYEVSVAVHNSETHVYNKIRNHYLTFDLKIHLNFSRMDGKMDAATITLIKEQKSVSM